MSKHVILASIFLDSGTEYVSGGEVHQSRTSPLTETRIWEGRVQRWGTIERSISSPIGLPVISNAQIRLADTDFKLRNLLSHQTPRRRFLEIKVVEVGTSEGAVDPVYRSEIVDSELGPGWMDIFLKDRTFAWIDESIPNRITRTNFPDLAPGLSDSFFNFIFGHNVSDPGNAQGVIPVPHIGFTTVDRYALAAHTVWDVIAIYRKAPGDAVFTVVDPSEFDVTVETTTIEGVTFDATYIDFLLEQDEGTEIQADVDGWDFRPAWGGLAELHGSDIGGPLRNPIDFFINITQYVLPKFGGEENFNTADIVALRILMETIITTGSGTLPYYCDGAIVQSLTGRELMGRFLPCFQFDLLQKKSGLISLNFTYTENVSRPVFSDGRLIEQDTFRERLAAPTYNQIRYRFAPNFATGEFLDGDTFNNMDDQTTLGLPVQTPSGPLYLTPNIEQDTLDMHFVRDFVTAGDVVARRASFMALGSYRQSFTSPLPEAQDDLELAGQIGLSTPWGLDTGGYSNKEVKVLGEAIDLDNLRVSVRTILRVPQSVVPPLFVEIDELSFDFTSSGEGTGS